MTEIDVTEFGYEKVLGKGKLDFGIKVKAKSFTDIAESKISEAGGEAITLE